MAGGGAIPAAVYLVILLPGGNHCAVTRFMISQVGSVFGLGKPGAGFIVHFVVTVRLRYF
jgi:hypothetical protein